MAPASRSHTQQFLRHLLREIAELEISPQVLQTLQRKWLSGAKGWSLVAVGTTALIFWNGRLVLATTIGAAVMMAVYYGQTSWQNSAWQQQLATWKSTLAGWNKTFLLAAASGVGATFLAYLGFAVWAETEQHWVATALLLQGMTSLGLLGLGLGQRVKLTPDRPALNYSDWIHKLVDADAVRRLMAVRELTAAIAAQTLTPEQTRQVADYFRLMLNQESEEIILEAVWQGLQAISQSQALTDRQQLDQQHLNQQQIDQQQLSPSVLQSLQTVAQPIQQPAATEPLLELSPAEILEEQPISVSPKKRQRRAVLMEDEG